MEKILRQKLKYGKFVNVNPDHSRMMKAIKGKGNKTTELNFCHALIDEKIHGWELHPKITGNPDIYFPAYQLIIFLDGCFWHGCPKCGHIPKINYLYWKAKITRNIQRDFENTKKLIKEGYAVIRFWEHELKNVNFCIEILKNQLDQAFIAIANNSDD